MKQTMLCVWLVCGLTSMYLQKYFVHLHGTAKAFDVYYIWSKVIRCTQIYLSLYLNYMVITEYVLLLNLNLNETCQSFKGRPRKVFRINHKISSEHWIFMPHHGIHPVDLQNCLQNILSKSFFTHGPIIQVYNLIHLFLSLPA